MVYEQITDACNLFYLGWNLDPISLFLAAKCSSINHSRERGRNGGPYSYTLSHHILDIINFLKEFWDPLTNKMKIVVGYQNRVKRVHFWRIFWKIFKWRLWFKILGKRSFFKAFFRHIYISQKVAICSLWTVCPFFYK